MAAPTYGASGTYLAGDATSADVAAPAGVVANSVVVIAAYIGNTEDPVLTPPAGFTLAAEIPVHDGASMGFRLYVMWHRATGAEAGPYAVTWTGGAGSASRYRECQAHRFEGCVATGAPIEAVDSAFSAASVTSSAAVVSSTAGTDRLVLLSAANSAINTWVAPSGFTLRGGGGFSLVGLFSKAQAAAGTTGTVQAGQSSGPSLAWLGALKPVGSDSRILRRDLRPEHRRRIRGLQRRFF